MGIFKFLFKWSLEITGSLVAGYYGYLKPEQQADLYGFYRSCTNSYRAAFHVYAAINDYKALLPLNQNEAEYAKQLSEVNSNTAKRLEELSRINKGVYMRLGQYLGHLKHAFPPEFYTALKDLNEHPNHQIEDYKYMKRHIEAKLGKTTR